MSILSRSKNVRVAIKDLRDIKVHPTTVGEYRWAEEKMVSRQHQLRAFGPGKVLSTRTGRKYQVQPDGSFRRLRRAA